MKTAFWFRRIRQSGFQLIVIDGVISGVGRKWKRSDSSDSDSVALRTLLTTPSFDFHKVICALTTPLTIPTATPTPTPNSFKGLWLVKASLRIRSWKTFQWRSVEMLALFDGDKIRTIPWTINKINCCRRCCCCHRKARNTFPWSCRQSNEGSLVGVFSKRNSSNSDNNKPEWHTTG